MENKSTIETYEDKSQKTALFNLTSDLFAGKIFEDIGACQELCRILLQNEHIILKNVMSILEKGMPYYELPDVTAICITKKDFIGGKRGRYDKNRKTKAQESAICLDNGLHESYFNLEYPTDDVKINELLEYFKNSDPFYQTKNFPRIVERVKYFKVQKEGVTIMCEIADRIRQEGEEAGKIKGKIEDILELLEELGNIPKQLIQRISRESNSDTLNKWLKCAAKASNFAEFEAKM